MANGERFLEVAHWQHCKHGQAVFGDVFLSRRIKEQDRLITILSDGLGSGVKANVLATLTATMAAKYIENYSDIKQTAEVILDTLPVCSVRKISYSTFTIIDLHASGYTRVIEHGNPPFLLLRAGQWINVQKQVVTLDRWQDREVLFSEFDTQVGDYLLTFSDGVSQAAMGAGLTPLGWGVDNVIRHAGEFLAGKSETSAADLARSLADQARYLDGSLPKDDITAAVIYWRHPRRLLLVTGPPFAMEKDKELAEQIRNFPGRKVICGGTTANIVARELRRKVVMSLDQVDPDIPPVSQMQGVDLITEGTLTLGRVADILEKGVAIDTMPNHAAACLAAELLNSDQIQFIVGTRINEAHQDPNTPIELEMRRNLIARIIRVLDEKYLKETYRRYV
jgi:hypothetical protein